LQYLRQHPEELRPYSASIAAATAAAAPGVPVAARQALAVA